LLVYYWLFAQSITLPFFFRKWFCLSLLLQIRASGSSFPHQSRCYFFLHSWQVSFLSMPDDSPPSRPFAPSDDPNCKLFYFPPPARWNSPPPPFLKNEFTTPFLRVDLYVILLAMDTHCVFQTGSTPPFPLHDHHPLRQAHFDPTFWSHPLSTFISFFFRTFAVRRGTNRRLCPYIPLALSITGACPPFPSAFPPLSILRPSGRTLVLVRIN